MKKILFTASLLSLMLLGSNGPMDTKAMATVDYKEHQSTKQFYHENNKNVYKHFTLKEIDSLSDNSEISSPYTVKENKYYIIYIEGENGWASSFVPLTLNPGFKYDSDHHITISLDDNGKIINGNKIIVIDHYMISNSNKEMIKKIAGTEDYDKAIKEIEDRIIEFQKRAKKQ